MAAFFASFQKRAKEDAERYLNDYPNDNLDEPNANDNIKFYRNEIKSQPNGEFLENIHKNWWGNYQTLEQNHSYIQWLFPIREEGMNDYSQPLMKHEREIMREDDEIRQKIIQSYRLMLDFYGFELMNETTGEIKRNSNYKERFENLNYYSHNCLRITRILKCLGEVNLQNLQFEFVYTILKEIFEEKNLRNTKKSAITYWTFVVRDPDQRNSLLSYIQSKTNL